MKPLKWPKQANVDDLIEVLEKYGVRKGYTPIKAGQGVLELQKTGTVRLLSGLSTGVRIVVTTAPGGTAVEFGEVAKNYGLKAIVALAASAVPPLLAVPGYGAYQQYQLLEGIRAEINDYINSLDD